MFENVLKFKPPLAFTLRDCDTLVRTIDRALTEWEQVRKAFAGIWRCVYIMRP
jgi:hypothetical protein